METWNAHHSVPFPDLKKNIKLLFFFRRRFASGALNLSPTYSSKNSPLSNGFVAKTPKPAKWKYEDEIELETFTCSFGKSHQCFVSVTTHIFVTCIFVRGLLWCASKEEFLFAPHLVNFSGKPQNTVICAHQSHKNLLIVSAKMHLPILSAEIIALHIAIIGWTEISNLPWQQINASYRVSISSYPAHVKIRQDI